MTSSLARKKGREQSQWAGDVLQQVGPSAFRAVKPDDMLMPRHCWVLSFLPTPFLIFSNSSHHANLPSCRTIRVLKANAPPISLLLPQPECSTSLPPSPANTSSNTRLPSFFLRFLHVWMTAKYTVDSVNVTEASS